nr:Chain P, Insulin receptor substrate 1 [Rattus norvegicus]
GYMMMSPS